MREGPQKKFFYWGVTIVSVVAISILFFFAIFKMEAIGHFIGQIFNILMPFVYGLVIAYLLIPSFNYFYRKLYPVLKKKAKTPQRAARLAKGLSTLISMLLGMLIVGALISMVLPQLVNSIIGLVDTLPASIRNVTLWLQNLLANNPEIEKTAMQFYQEGVDTLTVWIKNDMIPQLTSLMNGLVGTFNFLKNLLIGIIIAVYVLNSKELFAAQAKKLLYSFVKVPQANLIIDNVRFTHQVFGGFINGKLLDSLIIGVICFIGMSIFKLPYAMLVSVIIGVTNIIPFFGPFIGAIPSTFLILLINPMQAVYFLVFVFALQQFDGNILGPKILGDSTGLSSFWVMFAILLFGGLFGFAGMVLGVPLFAVFYSFVSGMVRRSLRKRVLPEDTSAYFDLDRIDSKHHGMSYEKSQHTAATVSTDEQHENK